MKYEQLNVQDLRLLVVPYHITSCAPTCLAPYSYATELSSQPSVASTHNVVTKLTITWIRLSDNEKTRSTVSASVHILHIDPLVHGY